MNFFDMFFMNGGFFDTWGPEVIAGLMLVLGIVLIFLTIGIVGYVFQSIGLYTIAKRRGIKNPWLAWVPIGCNWILGSIADQYQYVVKGKIRNKRKVLLILSLCPVAVNVIAKVVSVTLLLAGSGYSATQTMMVSGFVTAAQSLLNAGLAIALSVYIYMALYNLYTSCNPGNDVLFLVMGIIFGILAPFFIFAVRNKDEGMPPRRQPVAQPVLESPEEPQADFE